MAKKETKEFDLSQEYALDEALSMLPELSTSKFVGSVDVDIIIKPSKKKNQEAIRGSVSFPNSFGDKKRIIVFGDEQTAKDAKAAGAVEAGLDDLAKKVEEGSLEYDVVIATPDVMSKIARLGRVLGPKGLMPNPGNGTITTDVASTIKEYVAGKQDFKMSDQNAVRARVGKLDMKTDELVANTIAFLKQVLTQARNIDPQPFKKITLSPTMGKGVKIDIDSVIETIRS